jgi:hypothetical protein
MLLGFVVCFVKVSISLLHYLLHLYVRLGRLLQSGIIDRLGIDGARGAGVPRIALTCVSFLAQRHAGRNHERQGQPSIAVDTFAEDITSKNLLSC